MDLFYIGESFYYKSSTEMSSIYHVGTYERSDWGKVSIALQNGESVNIRPALSHEMYWAEYELNKTLARFKEYRQKERS